MVSFNPLHCGAVVSSSFSPQGTSFTRRSFNPLHCGAVVSSFWREVGKQWNRQVSIPFIAGQWSLRGPARPSWPSAWQFQSPSLRGSGLFGRAWREAAAREGFNPLHCGAVVSSPGVAGPGAEDVGVSIPFIAGQWSLPRTSLRPGATSPGVSIPFIAGQWSLHTYRAALDAAIDEVSIPFIAGQWSLPGRRSARSRSAPARFNPLHCGAVVASRTAPRLPHARPDHVSIPFIAGQWSLPAGNGADGAPQPGFNPLHCGAVVSSISSSR